MTYEEHSGIEMGGYKYLIHKGLERMLQRNLRERSQPFYARRGHTSGHTDENTRDRPMVIARTPYIFIVQLKRTPVAFPFAG
jgi:hypothetical protein